MRVYGLGLWGLVEGLGFRESILTVRVEGLGPRALGVGLAGLGV